MGVVPLLTQRSPLLHTEAMLLVNHHKRQPVELDRLLNQRMGAHDDLDAAIGQAGVDLIPLLTGDAAREQTNVGRTARPTLEEARQGAIVLLGQDLGGGHHRSLSASGRRQGHRRSGHNCLA